MYFMNRKSNKMPIISKKPVSRRFQRLYRPTGQETRESLIPRYGPLNGSQGCIKRKQAFVVIEINAMMT